MNKFSSVLLVAFFACVVSGKAQDTAGATINHDIGAKSIRVDVGGTFFTEFRYNQEKKPILYPVVGPQGVEMTRNYPMKKDVAGEAADHPHHTSLWFTHGEVNDSDFWANGKESIFHPGNRSRGERRGECRD